MNKVEMVQMLRSVGVNENTISAMCNSFDMGVQYEREECAKLCEDLHQSEESGESWQDGTYDCANKIRERGVS